MTALKKYDRIEAMGLWRADAQAQRRDVVVSLGDATLIISDMNDQAITHWSLAAIERADTQGAAAVFHPDGDAGETLELGDGEAEMIDAIETLRRAVNLTRPRPGRLRWIGVGASVAILAAASVLWLPGALADHAMSVVPTVKRQAIGNALFTRIERMSGRACADPAGLRALQRLSKRLSVGPLSILPGGTDGALHLPGGRILLNRALVEDFEEPDIAAGYALAEDTVRAASDPLGDLLRVSGPWASFRLLTTGNLDTATLDDYAEYLMRAPRQTPDTAALLQRFASAKVRSTPYAYGRDITGESVLALIEGDPMAGQSADPLLTDAHWLGLQSICSN